MMRKPKYIVGQVLAITPDDGPAIRATVAYIREVDGEWRYGLVEFMGEYGEEHLGFAEEVEDGV
jgi:hypothetical protein